MDPVTGAALIGGATSLIGGGMQADAIKKANKQNAALQREFAQHGIRWKVEDAKAAGIHPLAALGAAGAAAAPSYVGDTATGQSFANMGQDISRAVAKTMTQEERQMNQLRMEATQLDVEGKKIDNAIRASQLRKMEMASPPGPGGEMFMDGQSNSGTRVKIVPKEVTASAKGRLAQEAGFVPDVAYARTDTGIVPVMPEKLAESMEDDFIGKLMWRVRNNFLPTATGGRKGRPSDDSLPKGWTWWFNPLHQEWQPEKKDSMYPAASKAHRMSKGGK